MKEKRGLSLISFLILWVVEGVSKKDIFEGLGSAIAMGAIGVVIGGLVLFNAFLFFHTIITQME